MKKVFFLIILVTILLFPQKSASAHVLSTNNSIGAVIHIDPDDDPIIGKDATFFFEFKDKHNKFSLDKCICTVVVKSGNKELLNQELIYNEDPLSGQFTYMFLEKNVYTVVISGSPIDEHAFEKFSLEYDIRVTREGNKNENDNTFKWVSSHIVHLLIAVIILILSLAALIKKFIEKGKKKKS